MVSCKCKAKKAVSNDIFNFTIVSITENVSLLIESKIVPGLEKFARTMIALFPQFSFFLFPCNDGSKIVQARLLNTEYGNFFCHYCPKILRWKRDNGLQTPCVDLLQSHEVL